MMRPTLAAALLAAAPPALASGLRCPIETLCFEGDCDRQSVTPAFALTIEGDSANLAPEGRDETITLARLPAPEAPRLQVFGLAEAGDYSLVTLREDGAFVLSIHTGAARNAPLLAIGRCEGMN